MPGWQQKFDIWGSPSRPEFFLLNLAVGGDWPGKVGKTTVFPSEMLVDYMRIYTTGLRGV